MPTPANKAILDALRSETNYQTATARGSRRVQLDKGQSWTIRFLPAKMGPNKLWFARIAQHWHNKKAVLCLRHTSEDYGGSIDYDCPVCALSDELNSNSDKEISKIGYETRANPQWYLYCMVIEKNGEDMPLSEMLNPYEFRLSSGLWDQVKGYYQNGIRRDPDSILSYDKGNDFVVMRTANGLKLDKLDSAPIFDPNEKNWDAWLDKLEAQLKTPKITLPTEEELELFAQKIEDDANGAPKAPSRGRGRHESYEDPSPRSRRTDREPDREPPTRSRRSSEPEADPEPEPQSARRRRSDPEAEAEAPPTRSRRSSEPEAEAHEPAPSRRRSEPEPEPAPSRRRPDPNDDVPMDYNSKSSATTAAEIVDEPRANRPEDIERLPSAVPSRRPVRPSAPADVNPADADPGAEEEIVPEEAVDPAPAAAEPLPRDNGSAAVASDEPPTVRRRIGSSIRDRVASASSREGGKP